MRKVFEAVQDMKERGVFDDYALAGSVAFMVYTEPFLTRDVDFFVDMPRSGPLVSLAPLYDYAEKHRYEALDEFIKIDGENVQVLPAPSPLAEEGIKHAATQEVYGVAVRVMTPPYLVALALLAGRLKDFVKLDKLIDEGPEIDADQLQDLLTRFDLWPQWEKYLGLSAIALPTNLAFKRKAAMRRREAAAPFEDKLRVLGSLRRRADAMAMMRRKRHTKN